MAGFRWSAWILAAVLSLSGYAASSQKQTQEVVEPSSKIQFGGNYTYVFIKPSDQEQSKGSLGGAQGMYEYRPADRFYGGGKVSWKQGDTESSEEKRSLFYIDLQERLGYTFSTCAQDNLFTLFSGFGFRYLREHLRPGAEADVTFNSSFFPPYLTEATDTKLEYYEFYIPVGFLVDYAVKSRYSVGIYFTWMPQVFPTVDIKPLGNAFWALSNTWGNFLAEIPIAFTLTESRCCTLIVKPTYEYWQDGHSKAKTSTGIPLALPGNSYQFFGCDVNFCYAF